MCSEDKEVDVPDGRLARGPDYEERIDNHRRSSKLVPAAFKPETSVGAKGNCFVQKVVCRGIPQGSVQGEPNLH